MTDNTTTLVDEELAVLVRRYLDAFDHARKPMPSSMAGVPFRNPAAVMRDRYLSRDNALDRLREAVAQDDR